MPAVSYKQTLAQLIRDNGQKQSIEVTQKHLSPSEEAAEEVVVQNSITGYAQRKCNH